VAEVERFRCVEFRVIVPFGVVFSLVIFVAVVLAGAAWFAVVPGVLLAFFGSWFLLGTFEAAIGPDNLVTFRAVARQKRVYIEHIQRVERSSGQASDSWTFHFKEGSATLSGNAGKSLALRLRQLDPRFLTIAEDGPLW
jgi:hypothetical protein